MIVNRHPADRLARIRSWNVHLIQYSRTIDNFDDLPRVRPSACSRGHAGSEAERTAIIVTADTPGVSR
jgi:hypothetical protein